MLEIIKNKIVKRIEGTGVISANESFINGFDAGKKESIDVIEEIFENFLQDGNQSEKVKVPQFVADYVESYKGRGIFGLLNNVGHNHEDLSEWLGYAILVSYGNPEREQMLISAWRDGYEVIQERYRVILGGMYFCKSENNNIVMVLNDHPGALSEAKLFYSREEALEVANQINGEVVKVEQIKQEDEK